MKGSIERVESVHNIMPDLMAVEFDAMPEVGRVFMFLGPWGHGHTGTVMGVREEDDGVSIRTKRSTYRLRVDS
jgi:hypothetical protein